MEKRFEKELKSASKTQESAEKVFSKNQSSGNNNNKKRVFRPFSRGSFSTGYQNNNNTERHQSAYGEASSWQPSRGIG